jgi:hypothetical protein
MGRRSMKERRFSERTNVGVVEVYYETSCIGNLSLSPCPGISLIMRKEYICLRKRSKEADMLFCE